MMVCDDGCWFHSWIELSWLFEIGIECSKVSEFTRLNIISQDYNGLHMFGIFFLNLLSFSVKIAIGIVIVVVIIGIK